MTNLTDLLDSYVKKLKSTKKFEGVKFVFSGKVRPAEFPLLSFAVAVSAASVSIENQSDDTSIRRGTLHFDIYGHKDASKRDVNLLCLELYRELCRVCDTDNTKVIESSEAVYDSNICVWRQQIRVKLRSTQKTLTSEDVRLYLGGKVLELTGFESAEEFSLYPVKEVFCGVTDYADTGRVGEQLVITAEDELFPLGEFDLFEEVSKVVYKGCRVIKRTIGQQNGNLKTCRYILTFCEKIYGAEVEDV